MLLHEYKHVDGSHTGTTKKEKACDEINIQHEVADANCGLVRLLCNEIEGADVSPLCSFYEVVQESYNEKNDRPAEFDSLECVGANPGPIPDCDACGPGGACGE